MQYRLGTTADLAHIETFVWQAIFPAFDHPDLNEEQRASNDRVVEDAREVAMRAIQREDRVLYVAIDEDRQQLAGMVIAEQRPAAYPSVEYLIVSRKFWGQGVGASLLEAAGFWLGEDRPLQIAVRYYNSRAIAFFEKHGFSDSGESAGDYTIPHILMLRPAGYSPNEAVVEEDQLSISFETKRDILAEEAEEIIDLSAPIDLSVPAPEVDADNMVEEEDLKLSDLFADMSEEEELSETEEQETPEVSVQSEENSLPEELKAPEVQTPSLDGGQKSKFPHIELEIELPEEPNYRSNPYADQEEEQDERLVPEAVENADLPFEFAFSQEEETKEEPEIEPVWEEMVFEETLDQDQSIEADKSRENVVPDSAEGACSNCATVLPSGARFCFNCGRPQAVDLPIMDPTIPPPIPVQKSEVEERVEEESTWLPSLQNEPEEDSLGIDWNGSLISDFKQFFREKFTERVADYFGSKAVADYQAHRQASDFQDTVATQLAALADWVRLRRDQPAWKVALGRRRLQSATEALIEFYLVEGAVELHAGVWPQRLLRHQAKEWTTVDLFALTMDYLKFEQESDTIYTDFVQMPAKVLRNVSRQFLFAAKDERVLFVGDQSLLGNGKQGFAMTDVAIYWRPVLQSAQSLLYQDIESLEVKGDHLLINGRYFDGGQSLNLKLALLLRRLKTMITAYAA